MAEITCVQCGHGPHSNKKCNYCRCETFMNAELMAARSLIQINNILIEKIPVFEGMLFNLLEIVAEAHPEAVAAIDARREERRKQLEAEQNNAASTETENAAEPGA